LRQSGDPLGSERQGADAVAQAERVANQDGAAVAVDFDDRGVHPVGSVELAVAIARRDPGAVARIKQMANDAALRERLLQERGQNATWAARSRALAGRRERYGGG
jgi:hypothetical protein